MAIYFEFILGCTIIAGVFRVFCLVSVAVKSPPQKKAKTPPRRFAPLAEVPIPTKIAWVSPLRWVAKKRTQ